VLFSSNDSRLTIAEFAYFWPLKIGGMAVVDLVMPKMGESIVEATILKWHKKSGDTVKQDETVLDIATDKVDSEVPSTAEGTVQEILYRENEVVPVGAVIARINTNGSTNEAVNGTPVPAVAPPPASPEPEEDEAAEFIPFQPAAAPLAAKPAGGIRFYSPLVMKIAQEEGISMAELENIPGTGQDGRVSKKDILEYVKNGQRKQGSTQPPQASTSQPEPASQPEKKEVAGMEVAQQPSGQQPPLAPAVISSPTPDYRGNVEIMEMDRMRSFL
jgi:2-oxoglutarate dehydrogenase E2 component (dihydrolipoamide succinyltransferase)